MSKPVAAVCAHALHGKIGSCSDTQPVIECVTDQCGICSRPPSLVPPTGSSPSRQARPQKSTNVSATTLHCPIMMRSIAPRIAHSHFRPSAVHVRFVVSCADAAAPYHNELFLQVLKRPLL